MLCSLKIKKCKSCRDFEAAFLRFLRKCTPEVSQVLRKAEMESPLLGSGSLLEEIGMPSLAKNLGSGRQFQDNLEDVCWFVGHGYWIS